MGSGGGNVKVRGGQGTVREDVRRVVKIRRSIVTRMFHVLGKLII